MKSLIQEVFESIESNQNLSPDSAYWEIFKRDMIEREKKQMIDFAMQMHKIDCSKTGTDILLDEAEQYFNEKYNKNK